MRYVKVNFRGSHNSSDFQKPPKLQKINIKLSLLLKQCWYSSNASLTCLLYTKQSVQTIIKLIMKCRLLYFTKSNLEKKSWFPENSEFFEIHNFRQNAPKLVTTRRKFPGILVDPSMRLEKMSLHPRRAPSRIYGFPGPPRRPFWTLKRTPKNLFALNGLYGGKKSSNFGRNFAKNGDKILQKIHENVDLKKCSYQVVKTETRRLFFENIFYLFFFRPKICTWWPI